jgi:hypothetical protein
MGISIIRKEYNEGRNTCHYKTLKENPIPGSSTCLGPSKEENPRANRTLINYKLHQ